MKLHELKDKSILILGFGREGTVTFNFLKKHFPEKSIAVADKNKELEMPDGVGKFYSGSEYLKEIDQYDLIIKSPGIPNFKELEGRTVISSTQIFFDNFPGIIVGVTGTKGKSTTSSLIYEILKAAELEVFLLGNIGIPSLDLLDSASDDSIVVYELSSFQLEDLKTSPFVAVITNIYPEHLDRYKSFKDYKNAKLNITKYQTDSDYLLYEDLLESSISFSNANKLPLSLANINFLDIDKLKLKGEANIKNIKAAVLAAEVLKISRIKIKEAIENFSTLPHRLEYVTEKNGIRFYNDSLSTIPQATIAALDALGNDVETLIVGGFDRGVDYSILGSAILKSGVKNLILFPTTGEKIWKSVCKVEPCEANLPNLPIMSNVINMEEAVKIAYEVTDPGKICLLSPASTSFNMFKDYEDRGNQFKKHIEVLSARD